MARVTVEDCILKIPNRFQLIALAAQRARRITGGAQLFVERDNDKNPVVSLREIAEGLVDLGELEESVIKGLQKHVEIDEPEDDEISLDQAAQGISEETTKDPTRKTEQFPTNEENSALKMIADTSENITNNE